MSVLSEYPPNWDELRSRALERDGFRCRNCKQPAKWVHHVVPLSTGLGTNNLDNLFSICDSCHATLEPRVAGLVARRDRPSAKPTTFELQREVLDVVDMNADEAAAELMRRADDYAANQLALEQKEAKIFEKLSALNNKLPPGKRHDFIPSVVHTSGVEQEVSSVLVTFSDLEKQMGIVEDVLLYKALMRSFNMTVERARVLVELLVKEGILYSPKPGHLKRTAAI